MAELLSVCIPTFQRSEFLEEILASLSEALAKIPRTDDIKIYISDNASTDDTAEVVVNFAKSHPVEYVKNQVNVGADHNFALLIERSVGRYIWMLGDDELVAPDVFTHLLPLLQTGGHGLVVLDSDGHKASWQKTEENGTQQRVFANFAEYANFLSKTNPRALYGEQTLISYLVIERASFSLEYQKEILETNNKPYAYSHGIACGLLQSRRSVCLGGFYGIILRQDWSEIGLNSIALNRLWGDYILWLGRQTASDSLIKLGARLLATARSKRWRYAIKSVFRRTRNPLSETEPTHPPKITIITPACGDEQLLQKTIRSVKRSRYPNIEHIIMDGSDGGAESINNGIARATGDIIGVLPVGGILMPMALQKIAKSMGHNDTEIVYGFVSLHDENGIAVDLCCVNCDTPYRMFRKWKTTTVPLSAFYWKRNVTNEIGLINETIGPDACFEYTIRLVKHKKIMPRKTSIVSLPNPRETTRLVKNGEWRKCRLKILCKHFMFPFTMENWRLRLLILKDSIKGVND